MGLTARQRRVFDTEPSIAKAHDKAVKLHNKNVKGQTRRKSIKWTDKLKRSIKELIGGKNTYLKKGK